MCFAYLLRLWFYDDVSGSTEMQMPGPFDYLTLTALIECKVCALLSSWYFRHIFQRHHFTSSVIINYRFSVCIEGFHFLRIHLIISGSWISYMRYYLLLFSAQVLSSDWIWRVMSCLWVSFSFHSLKVQVLTSKLVLGCFLKEQKNILLVICLNYVLVPH